MPSSPSPRRALARRAFVEDVRADKKGWLQHGVAALAVSLLGLGVAGSIAITGNAQSSSSTVGIPAAGSSSSSATAREPDGTSRSVNRTAIDPAKVQSLADQRAEELQKDDARVTEAATDKAADVRDDELKSASKEAYAQARRLAAAKIEARTKKKAATRAPAGAARSAATTSAPSGGTCMPAARYSVAARFGQVGSWSRYHTGFDFSAPIGTSLRASAPGVVTNAGSGPASGWAGNYVAIKHSDGTQSLLAHMSTVSVSVGQSVSGCQVVGAIGMTGRTFGPHVHFEIYPSGVAPGDVYRAVNPVSWLQAHGLNP